MVEKPAHVSALCVVRELRTDLLARAGASAIDKGPVEGRVRAGELGLEGDTQVDRAVHGGPDRALYVYADEAAAWWAAELGRDLPPGLFGENLRTGGLDVDGAEIGERWRIGAGEGAVLVEVAAARTACRTFASRMGEPRWVRRFTEARLPGAYLRVLRPGTIGAGDPVTVESRPGHGVRVADVNLVRDLGVLAGLVGEAARVRPGRPSLSYR